jgi:thiol-disulfide isomerase/thioredoxin
MEQTLQSKPAHIFIPYAILFTALFAAFIASVNKVELKPYETEYPQESFIAPGFELPSLAGGNINLKDYRGKVVFINFWATWCATCKVEMPSMQKMYDQFKDKGLEMLTISIDKDQSLIKQRCQKKLQDYRRA